MFTQNRFNDGVSMVLPSQHKFVQPYDPALTYNRVVEKKTDDPTSFIYSIDTNAFLKTLMKDELENIYKLTLAGRATHYGTGIWDTLFNNIHQSVSSCICLAQADYSPIPQHRVAFVSQFLNLSKSVSRVHLNQVIAGDRIGIAIKDISKGVTFVLLYVVDDLCSASSATKDEDRPSLIPAINIHMEYAIRFDRDNQGQRLDMEEGLVYDQERATPFVGGLFDTVHDVANSYPWKPHFLPLRSPPINRGEIETRLLAEAEKAVEISYDEFEEICRRAYREAKHRQPPKVAEPPRSRRRPQDKAVPKPQPVLPPVEVMLKEDWYYAKLEYDYNPDNITYKFDTSSMGRKVLTETFLTNGDLKNVDITESAKVILFGSQLDNAQLRYFSLNF